MNRRADREVVTLRSWPMVNTLEFERAAQDMFPI